MEDLMPLFAADSLAPHTHIHGYKMSKVSFTGQLLQKNRHWFIGTEGRLAGCRRRNSSGFQVPRRFPIRQCLRGLLVSPQSIFRSSPLMGCFLFGLPLGVISIMCYGICTADADGGYIEERYEVSKSEPDDSPESEESQEPPQPRGGASPLPAPQEPKDVLEKKKDWA